jgi:hypothetical protein
MWYSKQPSSLLLLSVVFQTVLCCFVMLHITQCITNSIWPREVVLPNSRSWQKLYYLTRNPGECHY